jgi:hypothetical protein
MLQPPLCDAADEALSLALGHGVGGARSIVICVPSPIPAHGGIVNRVLESFEVNCGDAKESLDVCSFATMLFN